MATSIPILRQTQSITSVASSHINKNSYDNDVTPTYKQFVTGKCSRMASKSTEKSAVMCTI